MGIRILISAAKNKIPEAQYQLGCLYADKKRRKKAAFWLLQAAKQGYIPAMYELGKLYYAWNQEGVSLSDFPNSREPYRECKEQFIKWYTKAAQKGHLEAQYGLGNLHALGEISTWTDSVTGEKHPHFNNRAAIKHWEKAAQQGHPGAQFSLGWQYEQNQVHRESCLSFLISELTHIFPFSLLPWAKSWQEQQFFRLTIEPSEKAYILYLLAAKQGNTDAQSRLAEMCKKES